MADRPILFSGPMVRALLDGRKTQTRRVLKPQPEAFEISPGIECSVYPYKVDGDKDFRLAMGSADRKTGVITCQTIRPAPGDRLWVRETVVRQETDQGEGYAVYAADRKQVWPLTRWHHSRPVVPSIFMPHWASRLTLAVTDVRVQRLQNISGDDAIAEGIYQADRDPPHPPWTVDRTQYAETPRLAYEDLWDSLNAKRGFGWDQNPWVIAITFDVHWANIDQLETLNG